MASQQERTHKRGQSDKHTTAFSPCALMAPWTQEPSLVHRSIFRPGKSQMDPAKQAKLQPHSPVTELPSGGEGKASALFHNALLSSYISIIIKRYLYNILIFNFSQ
jgi:hypothetical protein